MCRGPVFCYTLDYLSTSREQANFESLMRCDADRRLSTAGMGAIRIVTSRLTSGLILAMLAAGAALAALAMRTGIADPWRAVGGTIMSAIIYLAIGVAVGSTVKSEINGSLVVIFIWMVDVFLGPAMAGGDIVITRFFPSHYVTLFTLQVNSGHAGPIGDLGWALVWVVGSMAFATAAFVTTTTVRSRRRHDGRHPVLRRVGAGLRHALVDYRRNVAMWVMLAVIPVFFITLSFIVTPDEPALVDIVEGGVASTVILSMLDLHGAMMVPITIGFLAGLAGLFVVQSSLEADGRLVIAGFRPAEVLAVRLGVIGLAVMLTTAVSLLVTAVDFSPSNWGWFIGTNILVAATYGLVGVIVGAVAGGLGGLYLTFLLPFIDIGLAQNVMFSAAPPAWGAVLPARGAVTVLIDTAFTPSFDQPGSLLLALGWLLALGIVASILFRRLTPTSNS